MRPRFARGPALEETAGDPVARLHPRDAGADFDHFAGAVGQRNEIFPHRHAVAAAHDAVIAEVQRTGGDFNQHLPVLRLRRRPPDFHQRIDPRAAGRQLISLHPDLPVTKPAQPAGVTFTATSIRCRPEPTITPSIGATSV